MLVTLKKKKLVLNIHTWNTCDGGE